MVETDRVVPGGGAAAVCVECSRRGLHEHAPPGAAGGGPGRLDRILRHRLAGPLAIAALVYGLLALAFKVGDEWAWLFGRSPRGWVEEFFHLLQGPSESLRSGVPWLASLLSDGILAGVGGVVSFVPSLALLFLAAALLEDSGVLARASFHLERVLRAAGLPGAAVPALVVSGGFGGGGCAAAGVLLARTLRARRDRFVTMLALPFMACGAKVPVCLLFAAAFFPEHRALVLFSAWALSWLAAGLAARTLSRLVFPGPPAPLDSILPPLRRPRALVVLRSGGRESAVFLRKAGTFLLAASVILWALFTIPRPSAERESAFARKAAAAASPAARALVESERRAEALRGSAAGRIGRAFEPASSLAGFGWRENIALIGGLSAKEAILSSMGTAYALEREPHAGAPGLSGRLRADPAWGPLRAAALLVFVLLYSPCLATIVVLRREMGGWRWPAVSALASTAVAFAAAVLVWQGGLLFGLGGG